MCYQVFLSTDSQEDLSRHNSTFLSLETLADSNSDPCTVLLEFSNKWYVGSKSGCSCSFRHLSSIELGFTDPVEWYVEEEEDIEATCQLYDVLNHLISSGFQVDLVDSWNDANPQDITTLAVPFDKVSRTSFRLFENHKFRLSK